MTQSSFTLLDGSAFSETDFSHKLARVNSFRKFPDEYYTIFLTKLVNTGFYYTLRGDLVQCFSCGIELHVTELTDLDNVGLIHKEQSPGCVFISDFVKNQNYSIAGITSGAEFPNYLFGNNRVKSLLRHGIDQSLAMDLARNGFFSEGTKSKVRCFHCGKEVHLHKNHLRMNKEHAEKSPNCTFLRKKQESSSTEWQFDSAVENPIGEICPPSSSDVLLDKAASLRRLMCTNCQKNEKGATFRPCNHSCLCQNCVHQMRPSHCLVCHENIDNVFFYRLASVSV